MYISLNALVFIVSHCCVTIMLFAALFAMMRWFDRKRPPPKVKRRYEDARFELKGDIIKARAELKDDIIKARAELKDDIIKARAELKDDIRLVRAELKDDIQLIRQNSEDA